jgi:hypothetical protein
LLGAHGKPLTAAGFVLASDKCIDDKSLQGDATMPFSKYHVDPLQIEAMRAAFYRVCDVLQRKCEVGDPMTELIAQKIVDVAKGGELDPERLCDAVLAGLEPHKRDEGA